MKNIAYVLDFFPVFSETFILREMLELRRRGFNVHIMARMNTTIPERSGKVIHREAEQLLGEVYYFSEVDERTSRLRKALIHLYTLLSNPRRYLETLLFAYKTDRRTFWFFKQSVLHSLQMKRHRVDHIHAHFAVEACKYAMLISMLTGIPYSFTVHAHDIFVSEYSDLMEHKFNHAKFAACISNFNKHYVTSRYSSVSPHKIKIIHCGVDLAKLTPANGKKSETFTMVAVGRLVEHKGFRQLVQACSSLKHRKGLDFVCRIIGEGEQRKELESLVRELDLGGIVQLAGAMEQSDVLEAMRGADLFVLPCIIEGNGMRDGIPVALMEAMALGVPVISTRVSGIPELVKDGAGILVDPEDVNGLATAVERVHSFAKERRKEMGERGRRIIEKEFNLAEETRKLSDLFMS